MLLALDQNHNLIGRIVDNSVVTFAAANSNVDSESVGPGQIVSFAGRNETTALLAAVKQNPQSDGTTRVEVPGKFLAFVVLADFDLLLAPLMWYQSTVESFWTQL